MGINLNPNNACNWRCIYCQVPQLVRGGAPAIDLALLEDELSVFLKELLHGDFMLQRVPEGARRINDIAISGNGEPTSSADFRAVVNVIEKARKTLGLDEAIKTILITNGSLMHRQAIQDGLRDMAALNGEVWFKLDRASASGMSLVNDTNANMVQVRANLVSAISCCPTWLQTCWFSLDGMAPSKQDEDDYIEFVASLLRDGYIPQGVLVYSVARPSLQPEAGRLSVLSVEHLQKFADRLISIGVPVKVTR